MTQLFLLIISFMTGALLGLTFFWGLWVTVKQLGSYSHPVLLMLGSLLLRFGLVLFGFYLLIQYGGWQLVLSAAIGFTITRFLMIHRLRPDNSANKKE